MKVSIDFETRSSVALRKAGLRRYAEDPSTEIICMAYALGEAEPQLWTPGQRFPSDIHFGFAPYPTLHAWNAQFEMEIWKHCAPMAWPDIPDDMWFDTMGDAAMCGFPLKLDKCAKVLGVTNKSESGTRLINKLSKPKADGTFWRYKDCPKDFEDMYDYCLQDVRAERAVWDALPAHVEGEEMDAQRLTWRSNSRGVPIDVESVEVIQKKIVEQIESIEHETQRITAGELNSPRQRDALLRHLEMNREAARTHLDTRAARVFCGLTNPRLLTKDIPGITLDNTRGDVVEHVLAEWGISDYDRKLLELQQDINHASVAKFKKILLQICKDRTVKDNLQYHGAGTGRDAARGFQLQNLPRATEKNPERLLNLFHLHDTWVLNLMHPLLETASTLIRPMICAPAGKKLIVSDYGQIEARGTAWTCKEEDILDNFRQGIDPYVAQASDMYQVEREDVTKIERQYGKLAVLACIAEGERVLTDHGLVPIEEVTCCMRVWDGVEWVEHDGPIYKGEQEVIDYDGLQATNDHIVYTQTGKKIELQEAAGGGERLVQTGIGRTALWYGGHNKPRYDCRKWFQKNPVSLFRMWRKEVDKLKQFTLGENGWVSEMQPATYYTPTVRETVSCSETKVPEYEGSKLSQLRGERNRVPVRDGYDNGPMGYQEPWAKLRYGVRPYKERWPLRAWKSSLVYQTYKRFQQAWVKCTTIPRISDESSRCKICGHHTKMSVGAVFGQRDSRPIPRVQLQTKRGVWDILNCGPRHRFTVEGKLVSNCGYQGSHSALTKFAEGYGLIIERKEAAKVVAKFRKSRPLLVDTWSNFAEAAMRAVNDAGTPYQVSRCQHAVFQMNGRHLTLDLPSGRKLWYPYAEIKTVTIQYIDAETGEEREFTQPSVTSMWMQNIWCRRGMSGGNFFQNYVQAICRDILMEAVVRVEDAGYPIVARVHDEIVTLCPDTAMHSIGQLNKIMCQVPEWCRDFPIDADGYESKRYKK